LTVSFATAASAVPETAGLGGLDFGGVVGASVATGATTGLRVEVGVAVGVGAGV
jgi:hypothetical protein